MRISKLITAFSKPYYFVTKWLFIYQLCAHKGIVLDQVVGNFTISRTICLNHMTSDRGDRRFLFSH